jgi:competence protein ComEC
MQFSSALRINPFARLLLFYLSGIVLASLFNPGKIFILAVVLSVLLIFPVLLYISAHPRFCTGRDAGIMAGLMLFAAGMFSFSLHNYNGILLKRNSGFQGTVLMQIIEPVTETDKTVKCIAKIKEPIGNDQNIRDKQRILIYFAKDSTALKLQPGDNVISKISLTTIPPPLNPLEFNYPRYLATRNIYNQAYIPSNSWYKSTGESVTSLKIISLRFQKRLIDKYRDIGLNNTLFSILSAVTLGYKSDLEAHTRQAFSKAGVMHVMALSGFNVAVIAFALNYMLFFTQRFRQGILIKTVIIVLVIWIFAFVTGLSPSVTRASVMISLILTGKAIHRHLKTSNILYGSAFILLTASPSLIYDVSFQLSFAAVFGIMVFHPPLYGIMNFKNPLLLKTWQLFSVSCAAQFATIPVTLFYFHQFPVYFWLTNLYVVPLVSFIICMAGIFLLVSFIKPLMVLTSKILGILLGLLYKSIVMIEILPFSVIENIRVSPFQVLILILLLLISAWFIYQKRIVLIITALILILLFQGGAAINMNKRNNQQIAIVGCVKGKSVINLIEGRNSMLLTSADTLNGEKGIHYAFANYWIDHGITEKRITKRVLPQDSNCMFTFAGVEFMVLNCDYSVRASKKIDVLIITKETNTSQKPLANDPVLVIIDSSVPFYKANKWKRVCETMNKKCWVVSKQGAWICEDPKEFIDQQRQYLAGQ